MTEDSSAAPVYLPPTDAAPPRRYPWYHWRRLGFNFLTVSLLAHLIFGVVAAYFVVQTIHAPRKQNFAGGPKGDGAPQRALEHKVQMQKQRQSMSAPTAKRVVTTGLSRVSLPAMPTLPTDATITPLSMAGMGAGAGLGLGRGGGGNGGGGGGGGPLNFFGMRNASGGLEGTFYDYKVDQGFQPIDRSGIRPYPELVRTLLPANGTWHPEQPYRHFMSPAKLRSRFFMFPAIADKEAGAAFQSPQSGPGHWLAVYRGSFSSPKSGTFRFVGFGDNVMIVQIGNHMVLDASDRNYTGQKREAVGSVKFPRKANTPLCAGEWFSLNAGEAKEIAVAVGDEGGIFCSGLFIQPKEFAFAQGNNGIPKLPVFMLGAATEADKQLLGKFLPPECLNGPYFSSAALKPGGSSLFSH